MGGWFSLTTPTTIDLSGLRDVLGAPLGLSSTTTMVPTSTLTDLTFSTAPPAGALLGSASIGGGVLRAGGSGDWQFLLALGDGGGKKSVRLKHRLVCPPGSPASVWLYVIGSDGTPTPATPKCSSAPIEETISLPGIPTSSPHPTRTTARPPATTHSAAPPTRPTSSMR